MILDPMSFPSFAMSCPFARSRKNSCASPGDSERVDQAEHDGCHQGEPHGNEEIFFIKASQTNRKIRQQHTSISLIPMNGAMTPPRPIEQQIAAE